MASHRKVAWYLTLNSQIFVQMLVWVGALTMRQKEMLVIAAITFGVSCILLTTTYLGFYRGKKAFSIMSMILLSVWIIMSALGNAQLYSSINAEQLHTAFLATTALVYMVSLFAYYYIRAFVAVLRANKI